MQKLFVVWVVAGSLSLVACGAKEEGGGDAGGGKAAGGSTAGGGAAGGGKTAASGGIVGAWQMDLAATVEANRVFMRGQAEQGLAQIREAVEAIKSMPADQQAAAKAAIDENLSGLPPEQQAIARAVIEGKSVDKLIDEQTAKEFGKRQLTLEMKGDKTFTVQVTGADTETVEGTWTQEGDTFTLTSTSKNGKPPVSAEDKEPRTLVLNGDKLTMPLGGEGGPALHLKRK